MAVEPIPGLELSPTGWANVGGIRCWMFAALALCISCFFSAMAVLCSSAAKASMAIGLHQVGWPKASASHKHLRLKSQLNLPDID